MQIFNLSIIRKTLILCLTLFLISCVNVTTNKNKQETNNQDTQSSTKKKTTKRKKVKYSTQYQSVNYESRIKYIVIHYTASNFVNSMRALTQGKVSSHYVIDTNGKIYQLVDENYRAWHAGASKWKGRENINDTSIGIELINHGYTDTWAGRQWDYYDSRQIDSLISLISDIQNRHNLNKFSVVGHSDIAIGRKVDPGASFPWIDLAMNNLIDWPNSSEVARVENEFIYGMPSTEELRRWLREIGYDLPTFGAVDKKFRDTIVAVQMKYRSNDYGGFVDAQTAAIIYVLAQQAN